MQMGAGRAARGTNPADDATACDALAHFHIDGGEMRVARGQAIAMIDLDHVAIAADDIGFHHLAGSGGPHRGTLMGLEIDARMHRYGPREGIGPGAERACRLEFRRHGTGDGQGVDNATHPFGLLDIKLHLRQFQLERPGILASLERHQRATLVGCLGRRHKARRIKPGLGKDGREALGIAAHQAVHAVQCGDLLAFHAIRSVACRCNGDSGWCIEQAGLIEPRLGSADGLWTALRCQARRKGILRRRRFLLHGRKSPDRSRGEWISGSGACLCRARHAQNGLIRQIGDNGLARFELCLARQQLVQFAFQ